jgi:hypothetical protein
MNKKICLLTIFLLFFSVFALALDIDAQSPITVGTGWSFTVDLDSVNNGENVTIEVNEESVLSAFKFDGDIYINEDSVSSKVVSYNKSGESISISYSGLSEGTKDIKVEVKDDGELVDEEDFSVKFVEPVTKEDQEALQSEVNTLNSKITNLESNINSKDAQISALESENDSLLNEIQTLQSNIRLLEQDGQDNEQILNTVKDDLNLLLTEREEARNTPIAGLFAFGAENSSLILFVLLVIALVIVGVFVKSRQTSIYDTPIFDNEEGNYDEKEIPSQKEVKQDFKPSKPSPFKNFFEKNFGAKKAITLDKDTSKKGKWAAESYFPENQQKPKADDNKRFDLGDLIKQQK